MPVAGTFKTFIQDIYSSIRQLCFPGLPARSQTTQLFPCRSQATSQLARPAVLTISAAILLREAFQN
jgi:hypothetical protein